MKKFIYLMVIVFLSSCVTPKAGFTSVKLCQKNYMGDDWNSFSESGFYAGLEFDDLDLGLGEIKLQPSIVYLGGVRDLSQVHAPIQFNYPISEDFQIKAGPSVGFLTEKPMYYKSLNLGFDTGLSYKISDKIKLESDYSFGLSNLSDNEAVYRDIKVNNLRIGLSYSF